ncbi:hypothetical protein V5799_008559, partial [Amblyomma americanum]
MCLYVGDAVCSAIFADPRPDVLIDAVRTPGSTVDKLSTAVRDTARRMGLPTLSLTYGVHNDYTLSGWDRLTALEREYLVHITPPGDIYTQVIRDLCKEMDLNTAGIIYDSSVIIDHKYARLLENIPTRHIMREVDGTEDDFRKKAELIHSTDVSNFFILGRAETLNEALKLVANWTYKDPEGVLSKPAEEDLKKYAAVTVFRVTTIVQPPFIVKKNTSGGEDQFEGYCIDLIDEIKKILKFEYTIYEVQDKMFGSINTTTKQWNGMIRELVDK